MSAASPAQRSGIGSSSVTLRLLRTKIKLIHSLTCSALNRLPFAQEAQSDSRCWTRQNSGASAQTIAANAPLIISSMVMLHSDSFSQKILRAAARQTEREIDTHIR